MSQPRVIKRYANRKLYDTQRSRYVTLDQISEMIRDGEDVQILDNNTKEDLTSVTLAQIIFEEEKKQKSFLPLQAMRHLIQSGGESIQEFVAQAGGKVRSAFRRDKHEERPGEEGAPAEAGEAAPAEAAEAPHPDKPKVDPAAAVRELLEGSQKTFDEWQKRVDERIRHAVEAISPFGSLQKEVQAIAARLEELEKRLAALQDEEKSGG